MYIGRIAKKLDNGTAPTDAASFIEKQKELSQEQRKHERAAKEILHSYRSDDKQILEDFRRAMSKEITLRRGVRTSLSAPGYFAKSEIDEFYQYQKQISAWRGRPVRSFEDAGYQESAVVVLDDRARINAEEFQTTLEQKLVDASGSEVPMVEAPMPPPSLQSIDDQDKASQDILNDLSDDPSEVSNIVVYSEDDAIVNAVCDEPEPHVSEDENSDIHSTSSVSQQESKIQQKEGTIPQAEVQQSLKKEEVEIQFDIQRDDDHDVVCTRDSNLSEEEINSMDEIVLKVGAETTKATFTEIEANSTNTNDVSVDVTTEITADVKSDCQETKSVSEEMKSVSEETLLAESTIEMDNGKLEEVKSEHEESVPEQEVDGANAEEVEEQEEEEEEVVFEVEADISEEEICFAEENEKIDGGGEVDNETENVSPDEAIADSEPTEVKPSLLRLAMKGEFQTGLEKPIAPPTSPFAPNKVHSSRQSFIVPPKAYSLDSPTKVSREDSRPELDEGCNSSSSTKKLTEVETVSDDSNQSEMTCGVVDSEHSSQTNGEGLKRVPLYFRRPARKPKKELGPICSARYVPNLHKTRDGCERCLHWASDAERTRFQIDGHHLRIMRVRGGCGRNCSIFPRNDDEFPVRLCKKCFFDTHRDENLQEGEL